MVVLRLVGVLDLLEVGVEEVLRLVGVEEFGEGVSVRT